MSYLTRKQAQRLLENPQMLINMTNRRWEALKSFVCSNTEFARDFEPEQLKARAWNEFTERLERNLERQKI